MEARKTRVLEETIRVNTGVGFVRVFTTKIHCPRCQSYLSPDLFYNNTKSKTGKSVYCKTCQNEYAKQPGWAEWRKTRYYADPAKTIWAQARNRAIKSKIPFDIEPEDCVIPENCPVLGIKLSQKGSGGTRNETTPTLDRIINDKGYVKNNVRVISWKANRLKSNCDEPEVFEAIAKYIRSVKYGT